MSRLEKIRLSFDGLRPELGAEKDAFSPICRRILSFDSGLQYLVKPKSRVYGADPEQKSGRFCPMLKNSYNVYGFSVDKSPTDHFFCNNLSNYRLRSEKLNFLIIETARFIIPKNN